VRIERLRGLPYAQAEERMLALLEERIADRVPDTLLLVEPEPVFTLGRRREAAAHVLAPGEIPVLPVARGGDVTFHGPGQLVGWPIVALPPGRQDLHLWMHGLEHVLIGVLESLGLRPGRDPRNTGVWLEGRKVAAIGIGCRRWVTWHGFALNLDVDLGYFRRIQPCGLPLDTVTRLADHLEAPPSWEELAGRCAAELERWWEGEDPAGEVRRSLERLPAG